MDYIPVYEGEEQDDGKTVKVSLDKIQRSGVRTEAVEARVHRASGPRRRHGDARRIAGLTVVTMRSDGYVEELFVNKTGQHVRAGEPLFRVYSPDIVNGRRSTCCSRLGSDPGAQRLRNLERACSGCAISRPESRICEARGRQSAHARLAGAGDRRRDREEASSTVNGCRPGDELYRIADHSHLWVIADVAESRSARDQDRHARHGHGARLCGAADRGRGDVHLSGAAGGDANGARAHRGAESRRAAEGRHVRRRRVPGRRRRGSPSSLFRRAP